MSPKNGFFWATETEEPENAVRSQARAAYLEMRERIIGGDLAPLEKLKISALARELGVSSSAMREALSRLASDLLVEARDQQGFRVAPVSLDELDDLTATRIDIESIALSRSIAQGDGAWEARVRAAHAAMSGAVCSPNTIEARALHKAFHDALLCACGNRALLRIRDSLFELTERYRNISMRYAVHPRRVAQEHDRIAELVLARDTSAALDALADHLRKTAELVREAIAIHSPSAVGYRTSDDARQAV